MPNLVITQADGSRRVVRVSDSVRYSKHGYKLSGEELDKKMYVTARSIAGDGYKRHRMT